MYRDWSLGKRVAAHGFGLQTCANHFHRDEEALAKMMPERNEEFLPQAKLNLTWISK